MSLQVVFGLMVIVALVVALVTWMLTHSANTYRTSYPPPRALSGVDMSQRVPAQRKPDEPAGRQPSTGAPGAIGPARHRAQAENGWVDPFVGYPDDYLLVSAPMVRTSTGLVTLRDWLIHFTTHREQAWPVVVATFYDRAASVPAIADYFRGTDMMRLQRHFVGALMLAASRGLTVGMVRGIGRAHVSARDSRGSGITAEIYETCISTLVDVLVETGVPRRAIEQLAALVAPLRDVIVREPEARQAEVLSR
jgi:hypothetical protein